MAEICADVLVRVLSGSTLYKFLVKVQVVPEESLDGEKNLVALRGRHIFFQRPLEKLRVLISTILADPFGYLDDKG